MHGVHQKAVKAVREIGRGPSSMSSAATTPDPLQSHRPGVVKAAYDQRERASSSVRGIEVYLRETVGMSSKHKRTFALKNRADEARLQQLRGIFAAFDENRDGFLTHDELASALLSLGVEPSTETLLKYGASPAAPHTKIDLSRFVHVTMAELEGAMTTETSLATLFAKFDPGNTGRIPLSALLHLLCETETPSALSIEEVNELLKMTGILTEMQAKSDLGPVYSMEVDYVTFCRHLLFNVPRSTALTATAPASRK